MKKSNVYFYPVNKENLNVVSVIGRKLLERLIKDNNIKLEKEIPLKVHTGQPGNVTFIRPENFKEIINYLQENKIKTYFVETNMVTGPRSKASTHLPVAKKHGFTQVPVIIADGEDGEEYETVDIRKGKYFREAKIAKKLVKPKMIIVLSHFKGHIDAGFGAAIKMLGIGFASRRGKIEVHSKDLKLHKKTIDWSQWETLYHESEFRKRMAEYALAAVNEKQYLYINYALNLVKDCDCDGTLMKPIYKDLGLFASLDPVAVDKAAFDILTKREGKKPFLGDEVFPYAEKLGLGTQNYELIEIN